MPINAAPIVPSSQNEMITELEIVPNGGKKIPKNRRTMPVNIETHPRIN